MKTFALYARLLLVVIAAQFYAAGLAIFGATSFVPHAITGWSFIVLSLVLVAWTMVFRSRRVLVWPVVGILLLAVSQPVIVLALRQWPQAAALHPVVGLAIALLLVVVTRRANTIARTPDSTRARRDT